MRPTETLSSIEGSEVTPFMSIDVPCLGIIKDFTICR
jgi:hypothetical protein